MSPHKKHRLGRWTIRILMLLVLLPIATMITARFAGWFRMRKPDWEIKSYLSPLHVGHTIDTLKVQGKNIVYLKTKKGKTKESALILVHGSPGSLDAFLEYMADTMLLAHVDLVVYDRPGFGNSDFGTAMTSLSGQADILFHLMQHLGYKKYWLAGHSYGAPVLVQAAMRHPKRIAGICLIAGSVSPDFEPKSNSWRKWFDLPVLRGLMPVSMRVSNEELTSIRQDLTLIEDDWDRLTFPVSIIHGTEDILVPFGNAAYAQERLTNADTVLLKVFEGESHFILWTKQKEISEELLKLIALGGH